MGNFCKYLLLLILPLLLSGCEDLTTPSEKKGEVNFTLFDVDFLSLDSPNLRVQGVSTWKHIYPSNAELIITNRVTGERFSLSYDPNNFSAPVSIPLPFGSYTFESVVEGGAFEKFLPFFLEGEFMLNRQKIEIEMKAQTAYGLITVRNKLVTEASIAEIGKDPTNLHLLEDESYRYVYVRGGLDVKLTLTESYQSSQIERRLSVVDYRHYNYSLQMAEGRGNFIDLIMGVFGFEEEIILLGAQRFFEENGTIKCPDALVGEKGMVNGIMYEAVDRELLIKRRDEGANLTCVCTSLVTDMSLLFSRQYFIQPIGNWDVSNVTNMFGMFAYGNPEIPESQERRPFNNFNHPIGNWDVSKVENMAYMFAWSAFSQPIGDWDVSKVTTMRGMFENNRSFDQPIGNWDVSNVKDMGYMFLGSDSDELHSAFNQPIGEWDVSNVTNMEAMFRFSRFNQPIGEWDVSSVTNMSTMFGYSFFNQPIGDWDLSKVENFNGMFYSTHFNQPIGNWDVSSATKMSAMFAYSLFNQPIGEWDVSKVENFSGMFSSAHFNQPIGNWDVSSATNMSGMFAYSLFNQPIGEWKVKNIQEMSRIFQNSEFNQDISNWCVSKIEIEPIDFATGSPLLNAYHPIWGTCPP